jgi:hypothetical protein
MTHIAIPDTTATELAAADRPVSLRDSSGRVLGVFLPARTEEPTIIFGVKSPFSREEIERRYREGAKDARPLSEFLDEMRQKHPDQFP